MADHSPGPWRVVDDSTGSYVVGRNPNFLKRAMAVFTSLPEDRAGRLADARLIAAAPDLLDACEILARSEEDWQIVVQGLNAQGIAAPSGIAYAIEKAKAAITKAYGTAT